MTPKGPRFPSSALLAMALVVLVSVTACGQKVKTGAEVLLEGDLGLFDGKRVGVVCNHTSTLPNGTHLVDTLLSRGVRITALFGPEHGVRGAVPAGTAVEDTTDPVTGIPVFSLYGKTTKPSPSMLANVDLLVFDIQDVGARFYTYAATMAFSMEAAAENGKGFVVLDRPNPINGVDVEGPVLDMGLRSLVGMFPVPVRHGLTMGELAAMIVGEGWIDDTRIVPVVVPMLGWHRAMWFDETGLPWTPPSPNMRTLSTATVYPGTCLIEATNLSEGRGTDKPFEYIGGPAVDGAEVAKDFNALGIPGVRAEPATFTPRPGPSSSPKHSNRLCGGIFLEVTDRTRFRPVLTGLSLISLFNRLYPGKFQVRDGMMDRLLGSDIVRARLAKGEAPADLLRLNRADFDHYLSARSKYLRYPE